MIHAPSRRRSRFMPAAAWPAGESGVGSPTSSMMMHDAVAVQERRGQALVAKDLRPVGELEVGGVITATRSCSCEQKVNSAWAAVAEKGMKPSSSSTIRSSLSAQAAEARQAALILGLQQFVGQAGAFQKAHFAALAGRQRQTGRQMVLPKPGLPMSRTARGGQVYSPRARSRTHVLFRLARAEKSKSQS